MGVKLIVAAGLVALLGLVALPGAAGAARADNPTLTGNVGLNDSYSISLTGPTGALVTHLDPGTYTLVLHDHSDLHSFHLSGPGVDVKTEIPEIVTKTFTITLVDGTYFYQCDNHAGRMHGTFTVGTVGTPPPPPPAVTKLVATVGAAEKTTLKPSSGLSAGAFAITVSDRSATDGFKLSGPGVAKATGKKFTGSVTWKVTLRAGRYTYGSVRNAKLRRTVTVS